MAQVLVNLYHQRLKSLTDTINNLQEFVEIDEALAFMNDQHLAKYKIDRITQLVREIMTCEKEKVIIQLIEKIQKDQAKSKNNLDQAQVNYYKKKLDQKNVEYQYVKEELKLLNLQRDEEKNVLTEQRQQFQQYQQKYQEIKQKYEYLESQKAKKGNIDQRFNSFSSSKHTSLQQTLTMKSQENALLLKDKQQTKLIISKLQQEISALSIKNRQNQPQSSKQKMERIEQLKRQIRKVNNQLSEMKEMMRMIKDHISRIIFSQLSRLKVDLRTFSKYIQSYKLTADNLIKEAIHNISNIKVTQTIQKIPQDDLLMDRMNILEGELSKFIDDQLLN